jgi:hypothetical protein
MSLMIVEYQGDFIITDGGIGSLPNEQHRN